MSADTGVWFVHEADDAIPDDGEEVFDFSSPEHVLIEVIKVGERVFGSGDWRTHQIETVSVIWGKNPNVTGAANYDQYHGAGLDYTIEEMIDCPGPGWWIVENVTGHYHRGEWGVYDDDMEFFHEAVRPATLEEIALA